MGAKSTSRCISPVPPNRANPLPAVYPHLMVLYSRWFRHGARRREDLTEEEQLRYLEEKTEASTTPAPANGPLESSFGF